MREFIVRAIDPEEIQWYEEEPEIPELVRCKDCKKCQAVNRRDLPPGLYCPVICADVDPTWYCANGVRKEGDGE